MSSYNKALKVYSLPQPGEIIKKKIKKKVIQQVIIENVNANNTDLDILFEIQRREHEAAAKIQLLWKKSRRLIPWRKAVYALRAIVKIQKIARGMIIRRYVAIWYAVRRKVVIDIQARTRRYLCNKHLRPKLIQEDRAIRRIQPIIRGYIGRKRYLRKLRHMCAVRIQALWRAVTARSDCDKRWLTTTVIPIQNAARRRIAMTRYKIQFDLLHNAANVIQRRFRLYLAKAKVGEALFQREMRYRMETISMLTAEEELCQEKIARLMERVIKQQIKEKAEQAMNDLSEHEEVIFRLETALIEITRQLEILSPRAYEQGYYEELTKNKETIRLELTQAKLKHMFTLSRDSLQKDEIFETQVKELEEWASQCKRIGKWRQDEYDERRHMTYEREINTRRREQSFAVGEETRKWKVLFYTKDGKPDKRRRPGRPWDPSVYAGPEKATYTSGSGVDLLAFLRNPIPPAVSKGDGKGATSESGVKIVEGISTQVQKDVDKAMSQVAFQAYLDQVKVYEEVMDPISRIMQQYTGLLPSSKTGELHGPEDRGWGAEGAKVTKALEDIGAMDDLKPNKRERIIGGFSKANVLFANSHNNIHNEHTNIVSRRGEDHQPPNLSRNRINLSRASTIMEEDDDFLVVDVNNANHPSAPGTRQGTAGKRLHGNRSQSSSIDEGEEDVEEIESIHSHILKSNNFHGKKNNSIMKKSRGKAGGDGDDASLDPGSAFPLGPNASAFSLRKFLQSNPSQNASFRRTQSRNAFINSATTMPDQTELISTLSGRLTSRGSGRSWMEQQRYKNPNSRSHHSLSSLLDQVPSVEIIDDNMSAMTEGDMSVHSDALIPNKTQIQQIDNADETISADSVYQSLRKCWKKPPKAYLPKPDTFVSTYFNDLQLHRDNLGQGSLPSSYGEDSIGKYSMSSGVGSKELGGGGERFNQLAPLRHSVSQTANSSPSKGVTAPPQKKSMKAKKHVDSDEEEDDEESVLFHRPDLMTDKQRRIEENTAIRHDLHERNRQRKKKNLRSGVIPWNLLDELDGTKTRFENEKSYVEFNHKF